MQNQPSPTETAAIESPVSTGAAKRPRGRMMMPLRGAMAVLEKTEAEMWRLIDLGKLLWCFDVSTEPRYAHKRELRILPDAIADYAHGRTCSLKWEEVFNLADRKLLNRCEHGRRGPTGSARFTRASFCKFLTARRVL